MLRHSEQISIILICVISVDAVQVPVFLNENDVTGAIIQATGVSWVYVSFGSASAGRCIRVLALGWFQSLADAATQVE